MKDTCYEFGKTVLLQVNAPIPTATYRYYDSEHHLLHTGTDYTTAALTAETSYFITIERVDACESAMKEIPLSACGGLIVQDKTIDKSAICEHTDFTITTVIKKQDNTPLSAVRVTETIPFADVNLISAAMTIDGKSIPYSRDIIGGTLQFILGNLTDAGTYTLTVKLRALAKSGLKTVSTLIDWNYGIVSTSKSIDFTVDE